jgi:hypothetical protein
VGNILNVQVYIRTAIVAFTSTWSSSSLLFPTMFKSLIFPLCIATALADHLGPHYPRPTDLTSDDSTVPRAWRKATSALQARLDTTGKAWDGIQGLENLTFSMGMFSLNDPSVSDFQFHYTSPEVANSPNGTNKVDADTIYRTASITKVFTVLTGMLELTEQEWDLPVSEVFPKITELASKGDDDSFVNTIQWEKITLRTLSAQISGLPTNPLTSDMLVSSPRTCECIHPLDCRCPLRYDAYDTFIDCSRE